MVHTKIHYDELVDAINKLNHAYYTLDIPIVSDAEYDRLYDKLVSTERQYPHWQHADSPTQQVGGEVLGKFQSKAHTARMYSLDKAQSFDEVKKFVDFVEREAGIAAHTPVNGKVNGLNVPIEYAIERKIDGLSVVLTYEGGLFTEGRSRGTGLVGEVITAQLKTIRSIPKQIPYLGKVEFNGEVFMPLSGLEAYNASLPEGAEPLKNARNGAAGAIRNLDPKVTASRPLDAFFYAIPYIEGNPELHTQQDIMNFLNAQGFKTNDSFKIVSSFEQIVEALEQATDQRSDLDYDIDGIVIKVNDLSFREELGYTSKFPKWAVAFKFEAIEEITVLNSVTWQVGRTGKITPLANVEPVDILGSTVRKATLNNYNDILRKGVKLGAQVFIRKSNDVIPEILGIVPGSLGEVIEKPTNCPDCGSTLEEDGAHLYCLNGVSCMSQSAGKFEHYAAREMMNIDGLSDKTIDQLMNAGLLQESFADLYRLSKSDLTALDRFGEKKADNLLAAIQESKTRPLQAFLYALGMRHSGKGTAERLLRYYNSIEDIMTASVEELKRIEDIGDAVANSIFEFFHNSDNIVMIRELQQLGVTMKHDIPETSSDSLAGNTFVLTGKVSRPRKDIEAFIKKNGGKTSGSISKTTNYLVAGEAAGSKLAKAQSLNVKIITEDELYAMV